MNLAHPFHGIWTRWGFAAKRAAGTLRFSGGSGAGR